jgi:lipid-binding SYLF domain-containing protein
MGVAQRSARLLLPLAVAALAAAACATPKGASAADKRAYVLRMHDQTLESLYRARPELRERLPRAAGYGVFSNIGLKVFLLGAGHGYGVVVDNATGSETFMRMAEIGAGVGLGARDFRAVYLFKDPAALRRFLQYGVEVGGSAEASAIAGGDAGVSAGARASAPVGGVSAGGGGAAGVGGSAASGQGAIGAGVEVYEFTQNGIALQATVAGAKYWKDAELNALP